MAEDMEVKADLEEVKSEVVTADMDLDVKVESVESLSKPDLLGVTDLGQVKASLIGTFATVCDRFGGPSQFLLNRFPSEKSQGKFRQQLLQAFPLQSCVKLRGPEPVGKERKYHVARQHAWLHPGDFHQAISLQLSLQTAV